MIPTSLIFALLVLTVLAALLLEEPVEAVEEPPVLALVPRSITPECAVVPVWDLEVWPTSHSRAPQGS